LIDEWKEINSSINNMLWVWRYINGINW
jgi:hypothetical protein